MIYGLNMGAVDDGFDIGSTSIDIGYDINGRVVYEKESSGGGTDEPVKPGFDWKRVKWVPIGDSISDLSLNGTATNPSDYKYQLYIKDLIGDLSVVNYFEDGKKFANGGCGYWRQNNTNKRNFLTIAEGVPSDATIVTIFGSVNDWQYRSIKSSYVNPLSKVNSRSANDVNGKVTWIKNPHLDTAADNTLAGYVADTLRKIHEKAPNAIVVVNPGMNYAISGGRNNQYMLNAYFCYQAVAQAMIDAGADWLKIETWYFDAKLTRTVDGNGDVIYTRGIADTFVDDYQQIDKWLDGNMNGTFDSRKIPEDEFGQEYCYDWHNDGTSFGHFSNKYHHRYLAVRFAHTLLNAFGGKESDLPEELRYNNA